MDPLMKGEWENNAIHMYIYNSYLLCVICFIKPIKKMHFFQEVYSKRDENKWGEEYKVKNIETSKDMMVEN